MKTIINAEFTFSSINVNKKHEAVMADLVAFLKKVTHVYLSPAWQEVILNQKTYSYMLSNPECSASSYALSRVYDCLVLGQFMEEVLLSSYRIYAESSDEFAVHRFFWEDEKCNALVNAAMARDFYSVLRQNSPFDLSQVVYEFYEMCGEIDRKEIEEGIFNFIFDRVSMAFRKKF